MKEEKLDNLLKELFSKRITKRSEYLGEYKNHIIDSEGKAIVEQIIRKHLLDDHDSELGELKAKVYAYEKIIANSNFSTINDPLNLIN